MSLSKTAQIALIDTLVNAMEGNTQNDFIGHVRQFGIGPVTAKAIYNNYWEVSAIDRMNWDSMEWLFWLIDYLPEQ